MTRTFALCSTAVWTIVLIVASIPSEAFNYRPQGQRFASVTLKPDQQIRITAANLLEKKPGSPVSACPLLVRFFDSKGVLTASQEMQLEPGVSGSAVTAPKSPGLLRAIITVTKGPSSKDDCAVKSNLEIFDAFTGATQVLVPGPECLVRAWPKLMIHTDKYLLPAFIADCVIDCDQIEANEIKVKPGERFAPVTIVKGQGIRVTLANLLISKEVSSSAGCPLQVRFFRPDGSLAGSVHEVTLRPGEATSVMEPSVSAGLVRATVNIKDFSDPEGHCAVKANLEVFNKANNGSRVLLPGQECHGNGECIPPEPGPPPVE